MHQVGLAIIGSTGAIGRVHVDAVNRLDSCWLVGINARRQGPCRQQAAEWGVKHYASTDEIFADSEVDAVVIATPPPFS